MRTQSKNNGQNHSKGHKKGEAKERPKDTWAERPKKKEKTSLSHGRQLFHPRSF